MQLLRRFLIELKRYHASNYIGYIKKLSLSALILAIVSTLVDRFAPFNFVINIFRSLIALSLGVVIFSLLYIVSIQQAEIKSRNDDTYIPARKKYSYKQRRNIATLGIVIIVGIITILNKPNNLFTIISGLGFSAMLGLLAFSRAYKDEYVRALYGVEDPRDLAIEQENIANSNNDEAE